jgi:D-3-phosphoglycerate dehydrogenase
VSKLSLAKEKIAILLLEGVHDNAVEHFRDHGYSNVELLPGALGEAELIDRLKSVRMVGIRSRTQLTQAVLDAAPRLIAIGCFCIGTNQVDLQTAHRHGVPVFNAPYSNTRSVAELMIAEAILLIRGVAEKSALAHKGVWRKSAEGSFEVRGKILGIVGYGHIGAQLSVLAESMGMQVRFFDVEKKLAIGNARPCASLDEVLHLSDVVSLHVPDTPQTRGMIGARELKRMKPGSILLNASRGTVVDIDALADALKREHLTGAAIDVFPTEPKSKNESFESPLRAFDNVILTPHIGGSTQEAQANIGTEVAEKLVRYSDNGSTVGAVNFVGVALPVHEDRTRFLHIHRNLPGIMQHVNEVLSGHELNVAAQYLQTDADVGYAVIDVDGPKPDGAVLEQLRAIDGTIRARVLL